MREFLIGFSILTKGSIDDKVDFAFRLFDLDNDGFLSRFELAIIVSSAYKILNSENLNGPSFEKKVDNFVEDIFQKFDKNKDGIISIFEFKEGI